MIEARPGSLGGKRERISELDALRGLAALAVTLYHYSWYIGVLFPGTPLPPLSVTWGCYGVQLFFAISGFVILMTLDRSRSSAHFARARFRRLFPVYWFAMTLTFAVVAILGPDRLRVSGTEYLLNLPMLQMFMRVPFVDGAYWSLNVELAFYACMLLVWRSGLHRRIEWVLVPWIGLKWLWWTFPTLPFSLGLLLIANYIPYFAIGILAYRIWAGQRRWFEQLPVLAFAIGTVMVLDPTDTHWLVAGLGPLFLALAARRLGWIAHPLLVRLGTISYPLYLIHGSIGYATILRLEALGVSPLLATLSAMILAVLIATAISTWIEPLLGAMTRANGERLNRLIPARRRSAASAIGEQASAPQ